jgi:hypothetical protein
MEVAVTVRLAAVAVVNGGGCNGLGWRRWL